MVHNVSAAVSSLAGPAQPGGGGAARRLPGGPGPRQGWLRRALRHRPPHHVGQYTLSGGPGEKSATQGEFAVVGEEKVTLSHEFAGTVK